MKRSRSSNQSRRFSQKGLAGFCASIGAVLAAAGTLFWFAFPRDDAEPAYISSYSPAPSPMGCAEGPVPAGATVAIIGDSYATGQVQGGIGEAGWPAILGSRTSWEIDSKAVGGSGYFSGGFNGVDFSGPNFIQQASSTADSALVILFGGRNDVQHYRSDASYSPRVRKALSAVRAFNPSAPIVVFTSPETSNLDVDGLRSVNQSIASVVENFNCANLVDTLSAEWFTDSDAGLIGADGIDPTDAGHLYLADRIQDELIRLGFAVSAP